MYENYSSIANELAVSEDEAGQGQQKIIETLGSLSDIKSSLSRLLAEKELLSTSLNNLNEDLANLSNKSEENKKILSESQSLLETKEQSLSKIKQEQDSIASGRYLLERKIKELENEKANINTQMKV